MSAAASDPSPLHTLSKQHTHMYIICGDRATAPQLLGYAPGVRPETVLDLSLKSSSSLPTLTCRRHASLALVYVVLDCRGARTLPLRPRVPSIFPLCARSVTVFLLESISKVRKNRQCNRRQLSVRGVFSIFVRAPRCSRRRRRPRMEAALSETCHPAYRRLKMSCILYKLYFA